MDLRQLEYFVRVAELGSFSRAAAVLRDLDRVLAVAEDDAEALPDGAQTLLDERAAARAARDFPEADRLREAIEALGWDVRDATDGFRLLRRR